jgi:hypothetical protein
VCKTQYFREGFCPADVVEEFEALQKLHRDRVGARNFLADVPQSEPTTLLERVKQDLGGEGEA